MAPEIPMRRLLPLLLLGFLAPPALAAPLQVYGVWHAGNDACIWGAVRDTSEFDAKNHWIVDRGDGTPSVNLVILSFIEPLKLLHRTTDSATLDGVPRGMTQEIVQYFRSRGIRVMISIGGITYVGAWESALAEDAAGLGLRAAQVAQQLGVGMEIDYEGDSQAAVDALQSFIDAYRGALPYDPSGTNHAARLTIDLAAGDRWLIKLCTKSTRDWLVPANPVLDYANAMVPARQPSASGALASWQEHLDGKAQYDPPIPPLAPCKLTASLYLTGRSVEAECNDFTGSIQYATRDFVLNAPPHGAGTSPGLLGYMFWAAECQGTRSECTTPPNSCENGLGAGAQFFAVPVPMPMLRQDGLVVDAPASPSAPSTFLGARPNPFRGTTRLSFALPAESFVDLRVYDLRGREVARAAAGAYPAGTHVVPWNAGALPAGTYFVHLSAQTQGRAPHERTGRVTLLR